MPDACLTACGSEKAMIRADGCEFCDGTVAHRTIQARFYFQGQTIYVDHVPAWVCTQCGEQYVDAPVSQCLEAMARQRARLDLDELLPTGGV
jgi:YgiT-type zinc finger domain-containing protein